MPVSVICMHQRFLFLDKHREIGGYRICSQCIAGMCQAIRGHACSAQSLSGARQSLEDESTLQCAGLNQTLHAVQARRQQLILPVSRMPETP